MNLLNELEKRLGRFSIANLTLYIIGGQVIFYALWVSKTIDIERVLLIAGKVIEGEVWRIFTFIFVPPNWNMIFVLFAWYLFYLMGTALENYWGTFRYNIFLLIAYLTTVCVSFITPDAPFTNEFIGGSVFLAFAFLYPDFTVYLFFILPVKVKWLAVVTWISYFLGFVFGGLTTRLTILASIANFLLFFGRDIILKIKYRRRRMMMQAQRWSQQNKPFHHCTVCGKTNKTAPNMEFRYCGKCKPVRCYCMDHIFNHNHIVKTKEDRTSKEETH
jgi:hypothetical protein